MFFVILKKKTPQGEKGNVLSRNRWSGLVFQFGAGGYRLLRGKFDSGPGKNINRAVSSGGVAMTEGRCLRFVWDMLQSWWITGLVSLVGWRCGGDSTIDKTELLQRPVCVHTHTHTSTYTVQYYTYSNTTFLENQRLYWFWYQDSFSVLHSLNKTKTPTCNDSERTAVCMNTTNICL